MYSLADGKSKVIKEYNFITDYGFDIYDQKVICNLILNTIVQSICFIYIFKGTVINVIWYLKAQY